jgi:hypothetical protein
VCSRTRRKRTWRGRFAARWRGGVRPGEQHGHYWYVPNVARTAEFPHVAADVNPDVDREKTFVHTALATAPGDRGSLTLFGNPADHELFARHIAESEQ